MNRTELDPLFKAALDSVCFGSHKEKKAGNMARTRSADLAIWHDVFFTTWVCECVTDCFPAVAAKAATTHLSWSRHAANSNTWQQAG